MASSVLILPFSDGAAASKRSEAAVAGGGDPFGVWGQVLRAAHDEARGRSSGRSAMALEAGQGSDPDTLGKGLVWVLDADRFPFYRGEMWHQFHDDMGERYSAAYHSIKKSLEKNGRVAPTGCPERRGW